MKNAKTEARKQALKLLREAATDERKAVEFFETRRWGDAPCCPRCGSVAVRMIVGKDGQREKAMRWKCKDCDRQYSVRTGTVFEQSRLPMRVWAHAYWRCCASKKGYAALQLARECGIGYRAALFCLHRIRHGMDDLRAEPMDGTVEVDETYCGGKPRRYSDGWKTNRDRKVPVIGLVQRGGNLRLRVLNRVNSKNFAKVFAELLSPRGRLITDEHTCYRALGKRVAARHDAVNHGAGEYVRGDVYTNTIEGAFSLLKRGLYGTFHSVSREHLHRYLAEFSFRYDTRRLADDQRVDLAIKASEGKRLTYREPASEAA